MAASAFKRSLSLPSSARKNQKACHVRSASLPCRSHPVLSQLKDQMQKMRSWILGTDPSAKNLFSGIKMLKSLHEAADDFLHLPQTLDAVRHNEQWANLFLDDQLKFLDVFAVVGSAVSSLREHQMSALVALRRREPGGIETSLQSFVNQRKKTNREMTKLATLLKSMMIKPCPAVSTSNDDRADVFAVFNDVKGLTVSVAVAAVSGLCRRSKRGIEKLVVGINKRKKNCCIKELSDVDCVAESVLRLRGREDDAEKMIGKAMECMLVLEDCLNVLERENDSAFRSLINTRVSILNTLTQ